MSEVRTVTLKIDGMVCTACEMLIEASLSGLKGVTDVKADYAKQQTTVSYDPGSVELQSIIETVEGAGYETSVA
ncbi:MAG: heavy-metal-associated domain-containing protein [Candidatus Aquicultorales bacterium]